MWVLRCGSVEITSREVSGYQLLFPFWSSSLFLLSISHGGSKKTGHCVPDVPVTCRNNSPLTRLRVTETWVPVSLIIDFSHVSTWSWSIQQHATLFLPPLLFAVPPSEALNVSVTDEGCLCSILSLRQIWLTSICLFDRLMAWNLI